MKTALHHFLQEAHVFDVNDMDDALKQIAQYVETVPGQKGIEYINLPVSFDTEFSSFYDSEGKKTGLLYAWMFGVCGLVIMGRNKEDFLIGYKKLVRFFGTGSDLRLIVYVHNLSADFEYIRKWLVWTKIFALDSHMPVYAITEDGIEFRCSYRLSGYSLDKVGTKLYIYTDIHKATGQLDYDKIRTPATPLTEQEIEYCCDDVKVVCAYIMEEIIRNNGIQNIPLTKTGYVRRFARDACFRNKFAYRGLMKRLTLEPDEFLTLRDAFQGGFTHSNPQHTDVLLYDMLPLDIASSYPAAMASERFPMGKGRLTEITSKRQFEQLLASNHVVFDAYFDGLHSRVYFDSYISKSKCGVKEGVFEQNGRVVFARRVSITITEVDFVIINNVYSWDKLTVGNVWVYESDYLPTDFVHAMLTLYREKTKLKDVEGMEYEYQKVKEDQNSFYGMTVTSPIRDIIPYDGEWGEPVTPEIKEAIHTYNSNYQRFLFYPWGVYTTAYARRNLWTAIFETGVDHVYSDTDSEKFLHPEKHLQYITDYNKIIKAKLQKACRCHGLDYADLCEPCNIRGQPKPLGAWTIEDRYKRFKTLGAKRYIYETDKGIYFTVAGLKKQAVEWLKQNGDPFEQFTDELCVPANESGRLIHTYIKEQREGIVTDYTGKEYEYVSESSVHLENSEYNLSMVEGYVEYIHGLRHINIE